MVAHVDQAFPGLVQDYEIWNEPDNQGSLCVADNTDATRRATYISMYDAAALAMHQQALADSVTIRVGGPGLGSPQGNLANWVPALLSDTTAAANIDFVSYHYYPSTVSAVNAGMNWDSSTGTTPLYQRTQDTHTGAAAIFSAASALVKQGQQANPGATPVLITTFNEDSNWGSDCCRNNATYGPLWNSLFTVDLLNTVYAGAQSVPNRMFYYAASIPAGQFCLLGNLDANMDCAYTAGTGPVAYPQYYSYLLFASSKYLGLRTGGNLALSTASSAKNLIATAFYTLQGDALALVNPTATDATQVPIQASNIGFTTNVQATVFLLNANNGAITQQPLALTISGSTVNGSVTVPAYSTVGILITGS